MRKYVWWLWFVVFFGSLAAASAQAPTTPTPVTKYDGTYAFVSLTKVNETYWTERTEHPGRCSNIRVVTSLIIADGHARYSTTRRYGNLNEGIVGAQGQLAMRLEPTPYPWAAGILPGVEIVTSGTIDENGTVRARRTAALCRYDLVWKKQVK
jgi:hypothetical protein